MKKVHQNKNYTPEDYSKEFDVELRFIESALHTMDFLFQRVINKTYKVRDRDNITQEMEANNMYALMLHKQLGNIYGNRF